MSARYHRIHDILYNSQFRLTMPTKEASTEWIGFAGVGADAQDISAGVWPHASFINHSCLGNVSRAFIGDLMVVRALRPIRAGEELLFSFCTYKNPDRKGVLRRGWGFECRCPWCTAEAHDDQNAIDLRNKLWDAADTFVVLKLRDLFRGRTVSRNVVSQINDKLRELHATYDRDLYQGIPRIVSFADLPSALGRFFADVSACTGHIVTSLLPHGRPRRPQRL